MFPLYLIPSQMNAVLKFTPYFSNILVYYYAPMYAQIS
jgi:hypothetical protein